MVIIDGKPARPKEKLISGELITVTMRSSEESPAFLSEKMDLDIVYEDDTVIVISKSAGLVAHPAVGNRSGMLLNGLLAYYPELGQIPRAGIVHRLDKETGGLMMVAKILPARSSLVRQFRERTVEQVCRAVASGIVPSNGKIEALIGHDLHNRLKMAVVKYGGKPAITYIKVLERYPAHGYIERSLETRYTHQTHVHMRETNHPLTADSIYGSPRHPCSKMVKEAVKALNHQTLYVYRLSFLHPKTQEAVLFEAAVPEDTYHLLSMLRLEARLDLSLSHEEEWFSELNEEGGGNWDEDDYDIGAVYTRDQTVFRRPFKIV